MNKSRRTDYVRLKMKALRGIWKNRCRFTRIQRIENPFDQRKSTAENIVNMLALVTF